jgi:hypothetical protein
MAATLPPENKLSRLIRYESMLDRELHRALSELRRRRAAQPPDRCHSDVPEPRHSWRDGEAPAEPESVGDSAHRPSDRAKRADFRVSPDAFRPVRPRSGLRKGGWDAL